MVNLILDQMTILDDISDEGQFDDFCGKWNKLT